MNCCSPDFEAAAVPSISTATSLHSVAVCRSHHAENPVLRRSHLPLQVETPTITCRNRDLCGRGFTMQRRLLPTSIPDDCVKTTSKWQPDVVSSARLMCSRPSRQLTVGPTSESGTRPYWRFAPSRAMSTADCSSGRHAGFQSGNIAHHMQSFRSSNEHVLPSAQRFWMQNATGRDCIVHMHVKGA